MGRIIGAAFTGPGRLTIGRVSGGPDEEEVRIALEDGSSRTQVVEIRMSRESFAAALFGRADVSCAYEHLDNPYLGKIAEYRTVVLDLPEDYLELKRDSDRIRALVAQHEVDGWMGSDRDVVNHHNWAAGARKVRVHYLRYVDPKPTEAAAE